MKPLYSISIHSALAALAFFVGASAVQGDTIGFFYALDADLQGLKASAQEIGQPARIGSRTIQRLQLGTHAVYAVKMEAGAVETASSAQALLSRFRCDWAFSIGPAGALADEVDLGRWYRVGRIVAWQCGSAAKTGTADFPFWETDWSSLPVRPLPSGLQTTSVLSVASGESFISTAAERDRLRATTQANAVDMNSFGLASVCADHGVPLFSWKVISDRADENAAESFRAFVAAYAGEGGRWVAEAILALPANPNDPSSYPAIDRLLRDKPPEHIPSGGTSSQRESRISCRGASQPSSRAQGP